MQLSPARQGFALPVNPDPPDYLCVTVPIPNDPAHVAAFLGVMYDLTVWLSWQSDAAHTAIKASTVWKRIFIQIQDEIGKCHTSGEYVAILEDFMSVCQQLRIHNGVLQGLCCFDPTTGEATWEDISGQAGGFLPSGATQPGAAPRPSVGGTKCYSVLLNANSQWQLPFAVNDGDQITISNADGIWSDGGIGWNCPDGTPYVLGQCVGAKGHAGGDPDTTDWHMQVIALVGPLFYPASGGTFTIPGGTGAQSLILQANDSPLDDNRGSISLRICVESGATPPPSTWCYIFDFTASPYDWVQGLVYGAVWTAGVGWQTSAIGMFINLPLASNVDLTYAKATFSTDGTDHSGNCSLQQFGMEDRTPGGGSVQWFDDCVNAWSGGSPLDFTGDISIVSGHELEIGVVNTTATQWTISRLELHGTGSNPFGPDSC